MISIFIVFIIWRLADLFIAYLIPNVIPYLGFFPYKDILDSYHLPQFISSYANFDGAHYISIARMGYQQYEQAFFPLYPLLIRLLSPIFLNNHLITGLVISNVTFLVGLIVFKKYLDLLLSTKQTGRLVGKWTILLLLSFPTSFFFGALYTEGLFFLFTIATFYFLKKERLFLASLFAFLSVLTRFIGVFLIIPLGLKLISLYSKKLLTTNYSLLTLFFSPILGLLVYSLYLWQTTGDPLAFFNSQASFNLNRSTSLILLPQVYYRYLKILFTASHNFQYFISLLEVVIFTGAFIVVSFDLYKMIINLKKRVDWDYLGLSLFSFVNLILPTLTGTFLSVPRFTLLSLTFFIFLAKISNKWIKISILIFFSLLHFLILGLFIRGYFIS